jgi:hypothetical protein
LNLTGWIEEEKVYIFFLNKIELLWKKLGADYGGCGKI